MVEVSRHVGRVGRSGLLLKLGILFLTVSLFGCDHATKIAAKSALAGGRAVPLYDGIVELRFTVNDDTAFSLLHYAGVPRPPVVLVSLAVLALLGVVVAWVVTARRGATPTQHAAYGCILAGALGNVVDRAVRGYVVDFIHVARWPVFNVADIAVCVGIGLLLVARARKRPPTPAAQAPP
jgi:signal peptidase II